MSDHHRPQKLHFESMQAGRLTAARPCGLLERRKKKVWLVQQGVWDMPQESMPLAIGMLKATVDSHPELRSEADLRLFNFKGGATSISMAQALFSEEVPDVLCFSVAGWNLPIWSALTATFKQLNPDGWVIWGGPHVTDQASHFMPRTPELDIIVNGEGELTFLELVRNLLAGTKKSDLGEIQGISFRPEADQIVVSLLVDRVSEVGIFEAVEAAASGFRGRRLEAAP